MAIDKTNSYGYIFKSHRTDRLIQGGSRMCLVTVNDSKYSRRCGLKNIKVNPTPLYEDNAACIAQINEGCIKGDLTKHITPKFFSTHDLQKEGIIYVCQVRSIDNLVDLFTKSLPTKIFVQLTNKIGLYRLKDIQ